MEELSGAYLFLQQKLGEQWVIDVSSCHFDHWGTQWVIRSLKTKKPTTKQTQLHAPVISLSNSHFLYLPLDWHCCQALMEEGKSNSFKITHCCLCVTFFQLMVQFIWVIKKTLRHVKSIFLTDLSLLKLFPHPFLLPYIHSQPFVFIKWSIYFSLRFKCFLIFSRFTEVHLAAEGVERQMDWWFWRCPERDVCLLCQVCMVYAKSLVCEVWGLGRVYDVIFLNTIKCGKRGNIQYWWATVADRPHLVGEHPCPCKRLEIDDL